MKYLPQAALPTTVDSDIMIEARVRDQTLAKTSLNYFSLDCFQEITTRVQNLPFFVQINVSLLFSSEKVKAVH